MYCTDDHYFVFINESLHSLHFKTFKAYSNLSFCTPSISENQEKAKMSSMSENIKPLRFSFFENRILFLKHDNDSTVLEFWLSFSI